MSHPPPHDQRQSEATTWVRVDVADVGALWRRDPDLSWEALNQLEGLLVTLLEDMGGHITHSDSDAFVLSFPSAASAIMWCARTQEGLLALDWPSTMRANYDASGTADMLFGGLMARMAIHAGDRAMLDRLATLVQPGQVLMTHTTFETVDTPVPPDLQVQAIGEALLGHSAVGVMSVSTRLLSRRRFGPLASAASALPQPPYCFVGRRAALGDLSERFEAGSRMVTVSGPRGSGKTHLALHWAQQQGAHLQSAVVALGRARSADDVALATALELGLTLHPDTSLSLTERLGYALATKGPLLLVLDDWSPEVEPSHLAGWLHSAADLRIIVTSEQPVSSPAATQLQLDRLDPRDAEAIFMARVHRLHRGGQRATHAAAVEVPGELHAMTPLEVEAEAGLKTLGLKPQPDPIFASYLQVADEGLSSTERVAAALGAATPLCEMGLADLALRLLRTVEPMLDTRESRAAWSGKHADALIAGGQLEAAHAAVEGGPAGTLEWMLRRAALALAEERFDECIAILRDAPDDPAAHHLLGLALQGSGEWEDAQPHLEAAAEGLNGTPTGALAWADLGRLLGDLGRTKSAEEARSKASDAGQDDPRLLARLHVDRFEAAAAQLELGEAAEHLRLATEGWMRCGERAAATKCLIQSGEIAMMRHRLEESTAYLSRARAIGREDGHPLLEAEALLTLGIAARMSGDLGTALDAFAEASALCEGAPDLAALIHAHRGASEAACDAIDNAVEALRVAEAHLEQVWNPVASTIFDALTGFVDLARAREAHLSDRESEADAHVDAALNRLARASSFETRSTPPRGRETPSDLSPLRLARLLLDSALGNTEERSAGR